MKMFNKGCPELQTFLVSPKNMAHLVGATSHTFNTSLPCFRDIFPQKLIFKRGNINEFPRSPYRLYFVWDILNQKCIQIIQILCSVKRN